MSSLSRFIYGTALLSGLIGLTTLLVIGIYYWRHPGTQDLDCRTWLEQVVGPEAFVAVVTKVEAVDTCELWIEIDHELPGRIELCPCQGSESLSAAIAVGDTLRKRPGEQALILIEAGNGRTRTFDFPCCD